MSYQNNQRSTKEVLTDLEGYIHRFPPACQALPAVDFDLKPHPDKWSKKELLGHLIDSARVNWQRFLDIAFGDQQPFLLTAYPQDALVRQQRYQQQTRADLLQTWQSLNRQIHQLLVGLGEAQLARLVEVPYAQQKGDLAWWIVDYVGHLEHHLIQLLGRLDVLDKLSMKVHLERAGERYTLSTDPSRLDVKVIHQFLSHAYWAKGRSYEQVVQAIQHSLNFGLYKGDQQIGYARVITDYTQLVYLSDVFILEAHRGKGLSKWMIEQIIHHPPIAKIKNWMLHTEDAHTLYARFGFNILQNPSIVMERKVGL